MYEPIWNAVAKYLSEDRMMAEVTEFFQESRWSSFDRILALARMIAAKMRDAGLSDVRLIELPADGRTAYGGWVLPKAYDVEEARLTEIVDGEAGGVLADYRVNPTSLMMYSISTPPEGITAELVIADRLQDFTSHRLSGRMVLTSGLGIAYSQAAVRAGAIGIVSDCKSERRFMKEGNYLDDTNEWHNYTIPPWDDPDKGFGFAITPKQGRHLRQKIEAGTKVRLHAVVGTRHYDGILPVISGRLTGASAEEIAITGHYDEFGADDNCSQVAVALEAVRAIRSTVDAGKIQPLQRTVRLLFPMEVRGFNALAQRDEEIQNLRSGLNIDTVGTDQNAVTATCTLTSNFLALPSLVDDFAAELLESVRKENPLFRWRSSEAETIDNILGEPLIGAPTPSIYHFSQTHHLALDTPDRISRRMLRDMARLTATYAAFLANAGLEEAVWLADLSAERGVRRIQELESASLRGAPGEGRSSTLLQQIRSLRSLYSQKVASGSWLVPQKQIFPSAESIREKTVSLIGPLRLLPQEEYTQRAGEFRARIVRAAEEAEALIRRRFGQYWSIHLLQDTKPSPVSRCVPIKAFRGFLSFEDVNPGEQEYLAGELGVHAGWGAPMWLQQALMLANGERTAVEIAELLSLHGAGGPDISILEGIFAFLAQHGLVKLREYVTIDEVREALHKAGLVAGDTVLGYFSLSQFGYLEGGADGLIDTLIDLLGPAGTLIMPTFTFSFIGSAPYDPVQSASRMGMVTDRFWRRSDVLRSVHPSHSFAAVGKFASHLLGGHDHTRSPVSKDGPVGKLADLDAKILMFCQLGSNILMQAGEYWSGIPFHDLLCQIWEGEGPREVVVPGCPWHESFDRAYEKLYAQGLLRDVPLGESVIHVMRCRDAIEAQAEVAREETERLIKPGCCCPYCQTLKQHCHEREQGEQ